MNNENVLDHYECEGQMTLEDFGISLSNDSDKNSNDDKSE